MSPNAGVGGSCGDSANDYSCTHGAQINFGDLNSYLTYDLRRHMKNGYLPSLSVILPALCKTGVGGGGRRKREKLVLL
jgi:hypothetical protein